MIITTFEDLKIFGGIHVLSETVDLTGNWTLSADRVVFIILV